MNPSEYIAKLAEVHAKIEKKYVRIRELHKEVGQLLKLQTKIIKEQKDTPMKND